MRHKKNQLGVALNSLGALSIISHIKLEERAERKSKRPQVPKPII